MLNQVSRVAAARRVEMLSRRDLDLSRVRREVLTVHAELEAAMLESDALTSVEKAKRMHYQAERLSHKLALLCQTLLEVE